MGLKAVCDTKHANKHKVKEDQTCTHAITHAPIGKSHAIPLKLFMI